MKTINIQRGRMLSALGRVARPVAKTGLACISSAAISMGAGPAAHAEKVQVVETSLGLADQTRLLRHLGLRVGPDNDFVEAHFGPGEGGQFADGFLKYCEGKVAESEYLDVLPAGETNLSKEEFLGWCKNWAKDRVFVTVGQNCWTMVHDFLTTHEGCEINDSLKFKEERVNQATQTLISAVEKLAAQEERTSEEIMQDVMSDPKTLFPMLFTAENLKELVPQNMEPVIDTGRDIANKLSETTKGMIPGAISVDEAAGQVEDTAQDIDEEAEKKKGG